jgi:hypothetical protein
LNPLAWLTNPHATKLVVALLGAGVAYEVALSAVRRVYGTQSSTLNYNDYLDQAIDPASPASGITRVYSKSGQLRQKTPNGYAFGYSKAQAASYYIEEIGSTYYAVPAPDSGLSTYSGTDAGAVINDAISALTNGGLVHLAANTTFNIGTTPVTITGGAHANGPAYTWVLEGEGNSSVIKQANAGAYDAIYISGEQSVVLRNFQVAVSTQAGRGIFGDCTGQNYACFINSLIENVSVVDGFGGQPSASTHDYMVYLINPFYSKFSGIYAWGTPTTAVMRVENGSGSCGKPTSKLFGNCDWDEIWLETSQFANSHGLMMISTSNANVCTNLHHFGSLYLLGYGALGSHAVHLDAGVGTNTFCFVDLEGFDTGIYLTGTSSLQTCGNHFLTGLVGGNSYNIQLASRYCSGNSFKCLGIAPTKDGIYDAGSNNSYENLSSAQVIPVTFAGNSLNSNAFARGFCGLNQFFDNHGYTQVDDSGSGAKIVHNLVAPPKKAHVSCATTGYFATLLPQTVGGQTAAGDATYIYFTLQDSSGNPSGWKYVWWDASI